MKEITVSLLIMCLLSAYNGFGQTSLPQKQDRKEKTTQISPEKRKEITKTFHSRLPLKRNLPAAMAQAPKSANGVKTPLEVPEDMIFPNESDEVQAVLMTWMYDTYTVQGHEPAEQLFEGMGISYYSDDPTLVAVSSTPDVSATSEYAKIFAELANGIQQHAQVWINIWSAQDSVLIKNFMAERGTPLTNYRFFINPGNSFWYRDCGPVAFYYGDEDNIGFMDFEYYGGRPLDDQIPIKIAEQAGYEVFTNTIEYEGGNILLDGVGSLFTSSAVYELNQDNYGLYYLDESSPYGYYYQEKSPLTKTQVRDSLTHLLNLSRCVVLPALQYDGGTGHIDLYCDMWDENTFVSTKHPASMANFSDPQKVESNMDSLCRMQTIFGANYYNTRIPLPKKNNGTWYTSQTQYNNQYTRSYSNHTFVNDAIMQPVFYDESLSGTAAGDVEGNRAALELMSQRYPGYTFEEIDVRQFDGFGGAIHCITKQIPAENPVRIYHDPVRWWNPQLNSVNPVYRVIAQNKSGVASAKMYYKTAGESSWSEVELTSDEGNMYTAQITLPQASRDTLLYYISVTSNNGKTITKPMTAPQGYYTTVFGDEVTGIGEEDIYASVSALSPEELEGIGVAYPNPAMDVVTVDFAGGLSADAAIKLVNAKGQVLLADKLSAGETNLKVDVSKLKAGVYWLIFSSNNNTAARKIVVAR